MDYLGEYSKEELEMIKRRILDPNLDEELGINVLYSAPLDRINKNDELF